MKFAGPHCEQPSCLSRLPRSVAVIHWYRSQPRRHEVAARKATPNDKLGQNEWAQLSYKVEGSVFAGGAMITVTLGPGSTIPEQIRGEGPTWSYRFFDGVVHSE